MANLNTVMEDQIVNCQIDFGVHSADELEKMIDNISAIPGVDEVQRMQID